MSLLTRLHPLSRRLRRGLAGPHRRLSAEDNFAAYRYGPAPPDLSGSRERWRTFVQKNARALSKAWDRFEDDESREVLLECLLFQILGWEQLERRRNTPEYRVLAHELPDSCQRFPVLEPRIRPVRHKFMNVHDVPELGLRLATTDGFFLNVIQNRQYHLERPSKTLVVENGDVVLDCGGGWGDTAVLFAHEAGATGRVYCFEFVPSNLALLERNLALNPHLRERVVPVPYPTSSESGFEVRYEDGATGTRIDSATGASIVHTMTIDDLVDRERPPSVDFIKMDIEGAEEAALRGAARTLKSHRPKLAISAYHEPRDLFALANCIAEIEPRYRFWLDHHTIHGEETVLYADAR